VFCYSDIASESKIIKKKRRKDYDPQNIKLELFYLTVMAFLASVANY
jgi:hypothetical protein